MGIVKWINQLATIPVVIAVIILFYLVIHTAPEKAGIPTTTVKSVTVAAVNPQILTASQICTDPNAEHWVSRTGLKRWETKLDKGIVDTNNQPILDDFGNQLITSYRLVITQGPDGLSSDVTIFQNAAGQPNDNARSEHLTPALTDCMQKGAKLMPAPVS